MTSAPVPPRTPRNRIDEGHLGREKRIRRSFDQLGRRQIGHEEGHPRVQYLGIHLAKNAFRVSRPVTIDPQNQRSGLKVSAIACPSRRNSGYQATSTEPPAGAVARSRSPRAAAVAYRHRRLPRLSAKASQQRRQHVDHRNEHDSDLRRTPLLRGVPTPTKWMSAKSAASE